MAKSHFFVRSMVGGIVGSATGQLASKSRSPKASNTKRPRGLLARPNEWIAVRFDRQSELLRNMFFSMGIFLQAEIIG